MKPKAAKVTAQMRLRIKTASWLSLQEKRPGEVVDELVEERIAKQERKAKKEERNGRDQG